MARRVSPAGDRAVAQRAAGIPAARGRLFAKFLYILVPVFLVLAVPGIGFLVHHELDASREAFSARIGNLAARTVGALARHGAVADPDLARDLLGPLAGDRAIVCAEVLTRDGAPVARHPTRLGCLPDDGGEEVGLPIGTGGSLVFRFDDTELREAKFLQATVAGTVIVISFAIAVLAASAGFALIVDKPLRLLLGAIRHSSETGEHRRIGWRARDELGVVIDEFDRLLDREQRRKMELHALNRELEARVHARTRELERAKSQAEAANAAKTAFLGQMSHELRTPLNAVIGFSELIRSEVQGPIANAEYAAYVDHIHDSGCHLLTIVANLLDIVDAETGTVALEEEKFRAGELVDACVRTLAVRAASADVRLTSRIEHDGVAIVADRGKLERALGNLADNAVKFTPGGGAVEIGFKLDPQGHAVFHVHDSGIGMRAEDVEVAMSLFGQVDDNLARRYDGAGLGLPVARRLAEIHGGSLSISSASGAGTLVTVTLPAARVISAPARSEVA